MLALAIDTSGNTAGLALGREDVLLAEYHFRNKMDLLRRLMPNVRSIISDARLTPSDLEGIVIALGPGSFTGLRIGVTAAKALAYALKKPIVGVPTLDVMARGLVPFKGIICPMIYAKPGEVYAALYESDGVTLQKTMPDAAISIDALSDQLRELGTRNILLSGDGARCNLEAMRQLGAIAPPEHDFPRASVLLTMGIERLSAGEEDDLFSLIPHYVRRPTPEIRLEAGTQG